MTGVPVRTLRDYVQRGLLTYSEKRGTITRYPRAQVLRLLAALRMRGQTRARWAEIKRKLDAMSGSELEEWAGAQASAVPAPAVLALPSPAVRPPAEPVLLVEVHPGGTPLLRCPACGRELESGAPRQP